MCNIKTFWKRSRIPEEDEHPLEPILLRQVGHPRNERNSTVTASSTSQSKRTSSLSNSIAPKEKKMYTGVVFNRPLPTPKPPHTGHPHITGYTKELVHFGPHTICRCALPSAHGDSFTRRHHAEVVSKITFLSKPTPTDPSRVLSWEEAMHTLLDAVQVDSRVSPGWHLEDRRLLRKVYAESTVKDIEKYTDVWLGVNGVQGNIQCCLEDDVFWWGEKNPKNIELKAMSRLRDGQPLTINGPFYRLPSSTRARPAPVVERNKKTKNGNFYAI